MLKIVDLIKNGIDFLKNQENEIRIRMLFFLEYAALFAGIIGTFAMLTVDVSPLVLLPNFVLIIFCLVGIFLSSKKKYGFASAVVVCGCAYIALPVMFFTAGGNRSGMPIWFLFGIIFTCMMLSGKLRIIMSGIDILITVCCMLIGELKPSLIKPLKNEQAVFVDMLQSFILVSVIVCICLWIYISSYDKQRETLVRQSIELKNAMYKDALTKISNRHAYYDATKQYIEHGYQENIVLVTMDVNGLKKVNDTQGHDAGDALIKGAVDIMVEAYEEYGEVFRTGGDEFVAILNCDNKMAARLEDVLKTVMQNANDNNNTSISIAVGVAAWNENKDKKFFELEKISDTLMYQNKSKFYRETGIDRRKR